MENFIFKDEIRYLDYLVYNPQVKGAPLISRVFAILISIEFTDKVPDELLSYFDRAGSKKFYFSIETIDYDFLDRKRWGKSNFIRRFKEVKIKDNGTLYLYAGEIDLLGDETCIILDEVEKVSGDKCKDLLLDFYYSPHITLPASGRYSTIIENLIKEMEIKVWKTVQF